MKELIVKVMLACMIPLLNSHACENGIQNNIIIHGIGGSKASFGKMDKALEENMPCSKSYYYEYDTKNSALSTMDFAKGLDSFLNTIPKTKEKDINFIMHSQGGLVGLNYLISTYKDKPGFTKSNLKRIKKFVSLSTPFWGSDFALLGENLFFNFRTKRNFFSPFGRTQLEDMNYGSQFYQKQIENLFSEDKASVDFLNYLKNNIKILNVQGMAPQSSIVMANLSSQFFEGDLVVNIPSMTLNTLTGSKTNQNYNGDYETINTVERRIGQQAYVTGTHLDVSLGFNGGGIVDTPRSCLEIEDCHHPGFKTLFHFLKEDQVDSSQNIENIIKGFELHVEVEFDKEIEKINESHLVVLNRRDGDIDLSNYRLNGSRHRPINIKNNKAYFLIKGSLWSSSALTSIELGVKHPEALTRKLITKVAKGKVTILKTAVKKEFPFQISN